MKQFFIFIGFICCWLLAPAQQEFHVFPETGSVVKGTSEGNGSLENPWDLQTALYATENIKPGDTLWLHEGVYNGRFISTLESVVHVHRSQILHGQQEPILGKRMELHILRIQMEDSHLKTDYY